MRGDHSAPRFAYLEGEVEIMSPSQTHEGIKSMIGGFDDVEKHTGGQQSGSPQGELK